MPNDSDSATANEADEKNRSRGNREHRGEDQSFPPTDRKAPGFVEAIKSLFRQAAKRLTIPEPVQRRRKEETRGGFMILARKITTKVLRSIFDDPAFWEPPDAIDEAQRLQRWHENNIDADHAGDGKNFHYAQQNHLSLDL